MSQKLVRVLRGTNRTLDEGRVYKVLVEVQAGIDYKGRPCAGYIINGMFPYVWDYDRFEVVTEEQLETERRAAMDEAERAQEEVTASPAQNITANIVTNAEPNTSSLTDAELEDAETERQA